jgi:isopropylmalate/homocitrate/citramalate synthase
MQLSDLTLREGDQMPGRAFTLEEKLECGQALDTLDIPFIEAGFPITGKKDQRTIEQLAATTDAEIIALARALEGDIDAAIDSNADIIETFVSVSDLHLEYLLGISREEMLQMLLDAVDYIEERGGTPHVLLTDAFRTDFDHLAEIFEMLPEVPYVTLADSVGARTPISVQKYLEMVEEYIDLGKVGVHFHDDLGCGTANVLTAYQAGVGKADVSVGGVGERAGNSPLEEIVAACTVDYGDDLGTDISELIPVCLDVLQTLEIGYDDRKAILGEHTTKHESGIHTAAMMKEPRTLEPFDPTQFGGDRHLVFGGQTGQSSARVLLERAGIDSPGDEIVSALIQKLSEEGPVGLEGAMALAEDEFISI